MGSEWETPLNLTGHFCQGVGGWDPPPAAPGTRGHVHLPVAGGLTLYLAQVHLASETEQVKGDPPPQQVQANLCEWHRLNCAMWQPFHTNIKLPQ